ncbi:hypothetical protein KKG22_03055 [Patescibacteria group bacterium]|nr:hypothetical protein [Patescibacteria group bacterium]MBU1721441.1 hypothetical protein [Patescibacteria group bacterium]MBU1901307.1 hypothetical protein [Patescibacteria group bacterium]
MKKNMLLPLLLSILVISGCGRASVSVGDTTISTEKDVPCENRCNGANYTEPCTPCDFDDTCEEVFFEEPLVEDCDDCGMAFGYICQEKL